MVFFTWLLFFGIAFGLTLVYMRGRRAKGSVAMLAAVYGAGCLAIAMIDKYYDERFRKLEKLDAAAELKPPAPNS
jgi:hypothetical protein